MDAQGESNDTRATESSDSVQHDGNGARVNSSADAGTCPPSVCKSSNPRLEAAANEPQTMEAEAGKKSGSSPGGVTNAGYSMDAAVDLHTGSIVFSEKGTLSDTYQWLLAEDGAGSVKPCPGFCYTDLCVAKCYSILLGFALVALIITVVMTVSSVPKLQAYRYTTGFLPTNCSTKKTTFHGHWETCDCSQQKSTYPCVQIYVFHGGQEKNPNESLQSQLIRSTEEDLIQNLKCSYKPLCNCDKEVNRVKVVKFINVYHQLDTSYGCYYNPQNHSEVIRIQTLNEPSEWGKMIVPASIFFFCMLGIFIVWIVRKNDIWPIMVVDKKLNDKNIQ